LCERKFFELLKVSSASKKNICHCCKFQMKFQLCKKKFQVFKGFLVKVLFCDI
jgi:hypothetical protein